MIFVKGGYFEHETRLVDALRENISDGYYSMWDKDEKQGIEKKIGRLSQSQSALLSSLVQKGIISPGEALKISGVSNFEINDIKIINKEED